MSDMLANPIALNGGLDLSTAKLMVEPGSMLDCLNYELVDELGYRRIDGYAPYDGHAVLTDFPSLQAFTATMVDYDYVSEHNFTNAPFRDANNNIIGFIFEFDGDVVTNTATLTYISFDGYSRPGAASVVGHTLAWDGSQLTDVQEAALTQAQFQDLQEYLISQVSTSLPGVAVGLHWFRDKLYAVAPLFTVHYEASVDNVEVEYVLNDSLSSDAGPNPAPLLGKVITVEAAPGVAEEGYLIIEGYDAQWETNSAELSGAVSVAGGVVNQTGYSTNTDSDYCGIWYAQRSSTFTYSKLFADSGWFPASNTWTAQITLSGVTDALAALRRGNTEAESTYYFDDGAGTVQVVLLDYYVLDGAFDTGDAVLALQFGQPVIDSGTHDDDITTADDLYTDAAATIKLGDVTARMELNALPGIPSLKQNASRYRFLSANFYASEGLDAIYGVNGAGRAFVIFDDLVSFIYTQPDAELDKPRHLENHALHLALGFAEGSVQLSVVGQPTNFDGALGASDIGVGDRVTGLMEMPGSTLAIFCEQSIWSLVGSTIDAFDTQVISPKSGCIEYTLVNCGQPVFCNNNGISTLQTSANYGDFLGTKLSQKVSGWLLRRLRRGNTITINHAGIACAMPVRAKNQYRLFFNDGKILTLTLRDNNPGFTFQSYYYGYDGTGEANPLVPLAFTSEVDLEGKERMFISHYNEDSAVETNEVFVLDNGDSFNGYYIPHYFDINWFVPTGAPQYHTLRRVRALGLSRGMAQLGIFAAGPQTDYFFQGNDFSTDEVPLNLPRNNPIGITTDLHPVTNITDIVGRGLAIQVRIKGSSEDYTIIEPSHVVQVLILFTTPDGAPDL
jgi:hypothetical protein